MVVTCMVLSLVILRERVESTRHSMLPHRTSVWSSTTADTQRK